MKIRFRQFGRKSQPMRAFGREFKRALSLFLGPFLLSVRSRAPVIQSDAGRRVRACAPNKVLLSHVVAVSENSMLLPTDFQSRGGSAMAASQNRLDKLVNGEWRDTGKFVEIDRKTALAIIDTIAESMEFDNVEFEWDAMRALIDYYSDAANGGDGKVLLLAETGRKLDRAKSGRSILGTAPRANVLTTKRTKPTLILLQQEGGRDRGWTAHHFWWPVLAVPSDAEPCVFCDQDREGLGWHERRFRALISPYRPAASSPPSATGPATPRYTPRASRPARPSRSR
jgi:hypothetical protein